MGSAAEIERKVRQLPRWARAICWAFGIGFGSVGSYAVFATDNQAGTAALLILSALFSIVALTGRVPQRLQFGDNAVEWPQEVADAVATAIEEGPPEVAGKIVSAISESIPDRILSIATDRTNGATVEKLAQAALMLAAVQLEDETGDTFHVMSHLNDGMFDLQVVRVDGLNVNHKVSVVVKRFGQLRFDFVQNLIAYASQSSSNRIMLIIYGNVTVGSIELLTRKSNLYAVHVGGSLRFEDAVDRVKQCLRTAFQLNSDPTG